MDRIQDLDLEMLWPGWSSPCSALTVLCDVLYSCGGLFSECSTFISSLTSVGLSCELCTVRDPQEIGSTKSPQASRQKFVHVLCAGWESRARCYNGELTACLMAEGQGLQCRVQPRSLLESRHRQTDGPQIVCV